MNLPRSAYRNGVNLGGWLSQYAEFSETHFSAFITESDIQRIAGWGMDHVRLPVDCSVIEENVPPHAPIASGLARLDACVGWCEKAGLKLILDLHKAPGYSFDSLEENSLFENPALQQRMLRIWEGLAHHYRGRCPEMVFELMNEVVLPDSGPWNQLIHEIVPAIRAIDPKRLIMVGGNRYNAVTELVNLKLFDDPRVLYTFHFYEPFPITHQHAPWVPQLMAYSRTLHYPGPIEGMGKFLDESPEWREQLGSFVGMKANRDALWRYLHHAVDFMRDNKVPLYCGEFGVIDRAPAATRVRWNQDVIRLFNEHGIGRAVWSYKEMDFGLVDRAGRVRDEALVNAVSQI